MANFRRIAFGSLYASFFILLIIVLFNFAFNTISISNSERKVRQITQQILPFVEQLKELELLTTEARLHATNWAYREGRNIEDREALIKINEDKYPLMKEKLLGAKTDLMIAQEDKDTLNVIFQNIDALIEANQELLTNLETFDDFSDPSLLLHQEIVVMDILPLNDAIDRSIENLTAVNRERVNLRQQDIIGSLNTMAYVMPIVSGVILIILVFSGLLIFKRITQPVKQVRDNLLVLSRGVVPDRIINAPKGVIGEMVAALNTLKGSFSKTAKFAEEVGKSNWEASFEPLSQQDILGNALLQMRKSLKAYAEEMEAKVKEKTREMIRSQKELEQTYANIEKKDADLQATSAKINQLSEAATQANTQITDNINYAKRMQEVMFADLPKIRKQVPEFFLFLKPRDVVSGDFYWYNNPAEHDKMAQDKIIIAAGDCTRAGVPGAFMSLVGMANLNQTVFLKNKIEPDEILRELNRDIKALFKNNDNEHHLDQKDGIDLGICTWDRKNNVLEFAGAKMPLIYIQNHELHLLKGIRYNIGSAEEEALNFSKHRIELDPYEPTSFYLFSNGFQNQTGQQEGKKFMLKRLKQLFWEIHEKPIEEQRTILEQSLQTWQGDRKQDDDIMILGFKL
ncbi:MAG: SpoIIE family protein phosphatase [Bernardetiaceae bacterium]|nr:SpoIIE family protein phosphatase [Bernardetiaceae bacterium]